MDLDKKTMQKIMLLILFAALLFTGLQRFDVVLAAIGFLWRLVFPFVLGGAIAFILNVPMQFFERKLFSEKRNLKKKERKRLARPLCLVLTILLLVAILTLVILVVIPDLTTTVIGLGKSIEQKIPQLQRQTMELFYDNPAVTSLLTNLEVNWEKLLQSTINLLKAGAGNFLSSTWSVTRSIVSAVTHFGIGFVFACYILLQKEKLAEQLVKVLYAFLPDKRVERILYICRKSHRTFSSFLTGQCLEALILGCMFFISMSVLRFPYALLVGVLIAFTALIPIFGAFIGCVVGTLLILVESPMKALMFLILFFVLQQIEGNLIYPHVVGGSVGLPSIWVLVAVTIGGNLMGIAGMLIFIPMVSVLYSLFREWVYQRLAQKEEAARPSPPEA